MHEGELFRPARPWGRWLLAAAAVLTGAGVLLYALGGDDPARRAVVEPSTSPSASPSSETATPTPTPALTTSTPSPTTATATPAPSATASRSRRPTPTATPSPAETADGVPGWSVAGGSCAQGGAPGASVPPAPNLTVELLLPTNAFRAGTPITATVRVRNDGDRRVTFATTDAGDDGTLLDAGRGVSAVYSQRVVSVQWTLDPGRTAQRTVTIQTESCGDTSRSPGRPLPADRAYQAVVTLAHARGRWSTPAQSVTLFR